MTNLNSFLIDSSTKDAFKSSLSSRGGYITFSNSGRRGESKQFQISLDSIIQSLRDILDNIEAFKSLTQYDERAWREAGTSYFSDLVANAMSASQTKPFFVMLSKVIKWANNPKYTSLDTSNQIVIDNDALTMSISKLDEVAEEFTPNPKHQKPLLLEAPLQIIYYGAPGTGKSYAIDNATAHYGSVRTTFHPDSDYASFVGAYKPTMEDVPINSIYGESVQFATGKNGHPGTEKKIVYKYVPQAFLKTYVAAWSNLSEPYFLIIEEINRGNCAQIFGDLFQLLDRNNSGSSSYAIHADEDIMQFLRSDSKGFAALSDEQKDAISSYVLTKDSGAIVTLGQKILDGELLLLPPNLYIWATMNTSDQSLFPIDSAFKRRWNWRYMPIDTKKENWTFEIKGTRYSWGQFLEKINPEIYSLTESSDKQMGYFFAKADPKTGVISEEVFLNKVLFYLWTDVFKDYDVSSELFKNKDKNRSFRFIDFFDKEQPDALQDFIDNFGLDPIEIEPENAADEEASERKGKYYKPYKSLTVTFPDGSVIKEDTIVDSYLKALETIGIDRAAEIAATKKYQRGGHPLITREPVQELIEKGYTYATIGDYSVLKGIKNRSFVALLKQISDTLNLNLTATLE